MAGAKPPLWICTSCLQGRSESELSWAQEHSILRREPLKWQLFFVRIAVRREALRESPSRSCKHPLSTGSLLISLVFTWTSCAWGHWMEANHVVQVGRGVNHIVHIRSGSPLDYCYYLEHGISSARKEILLCKLTTHASKHSQTRICVNASCWIPIHASCQN